MRQVSLVTLAALVILAPAGAAGQSLFPKTPVKKDYPPPPPVEQKEVPYKSPVSAVMWSIGGTFGCIALGALVTKAGSAGGAGLILTGLLLGPSFGHMYTGHIGRMWTFTLLRTGSMVFVIAGAMASMASSFGDEDGSGDNSGEQMAAVGMIGLLGLTIVEFVYVGYSAQEFNEEARRRSISLTPMVFPDPSGDNAPNWGLSFAWSF